MIQYSSKDYTCYKLGLVALVKYNDGFWIRVFGYGFSLLHNPPVLFSERYGYRKSIRIVGWRFEWLKKA